MSMFPRIFLNRHEEEEIRHGFPWVYDNEIAFIKYTDSQGLVQKSFSECTVPDGSAVEVYTKGGMLLGTGIVNKKSKIAIRLLCASKADTLFDSSTDLHTPRAAAFFRKLIEDAYAARFLYFAKSDSYRLVFAEADLIPGFIADRYCNEQGQIYIVVQFLSLSCEVFREELIQAIRDVCHPYGIYERSDVSVRSLEGLEERSGWIWGSRDELLVIKENGIYLEVDIAHGQKTGYFLDQKFNRATATSLASGRRVLDTFSHTGSFGLHAVHGGAKQVIAADISQEAVAMIQRNIERNKAGKLMSAVCADVFELLRTYEAAGERFDMIILDPPAFTKSSRNTDRAYGGYKEINLRAMKLLLSGGILISCSCSHFFDAEHFYGMLNNAAGDAKRRIQFLEKRGAGPDHPVLSGYERSEYLKCAVMRVL